MSREPFTKRFARNMRTKLDGMLKTPELDAAQADFYAAIEGMSVLELEALAAALLVMEEMLQGRDDLPSVVLPAIARARRAIAAMLRICAELEKL